MISPHTVALIALIVTASSTVQSMIGFGFALLAVPLFILLGLSLPEAVAIAATGTLIQGIVTAVQLRRHIRWHDITIVSLLRIFATPLGVGAMVLLVGLGTERVKQAVGAVLLVALAVWQAVRVQPRERVSTGWGLAAGTASGLLNGSVGMGGPPLVMWTLAHRWSSEEMRASLVVIFILVTPLQLGMLWHQFGSAVPQACLLGLFLTPLIAAGASLGLVLSRRLSTPLLRQVMFSLLIATALYAIATPLVQRLLAG